MRFSPQLLDDIRARLPVSQVVSRRVALKKAGREWRGLSPFKSERSPSFFVNDHKGFYHCFASGEHGDIFKFVMATEGLTFPEAVERLAAEAGISMPKDTSTVQDRQRDDERARLMALLDASAAYFSASLHGSSGAEARRYLEKRGVDRATITEFGIGFAPASRSALKDHLATKGFTTPDMITSGMLIGGEDIPVPYDRFRGRVMFPICDAKGRPIAFGGRALDADAPAKYLNSPETPLFHKGAQLFNAHRARPAAFEHGQIMVVEGYMDVVALAQAGFLNAVAPLGTALTEDQVRLLWRMAPEPTLCFDGDAAGKKAAWRAIDTVLPNLSPGMSVAFAFLPDGLDPDDLVRQGGAEAVTSVMEATRPLADVLWEREWNAGDWTTPERRAMLEKRISELLSHIRESTVRGHYEREMRSRLAKAWGHSGGASTAGGARRAWESDRGQSRPNQDRGRRPAMRGTASKYRSASSGRSPLAEQFATPAATSSLRDSPMVQGSPHTPPLRETLIVRTLLNHPWLIDEDSERIAGLRLNSVPLARLRDAILEVHASNNPLDRTALQTQLSRSGLDKVIDLIERAATHKSDKFAEPDADMALVEQGWRHALALHEQQVELRHALDAAEQVWHHDGNAEAFARICDIRQQLEAVEGLADGNE